MNMPSPSHHLPPRITQPETTESMMSAVLIALLPALAMGAFFFGLRVLLLAAISVASSVIFEGLYRHLTGQAQTFDDLSACVTGLLLSMSLPAAASYWVPVLGSAFGIIVVKQFYGGLGRNFMNPALAGRMLVASFPMLMTTFSVPLDRLSLFRVDAVSAPTPMSYLHEGVLPPETMGQLLLGQKGGCLGEVSAFMLLLGGGYLIARHVISLRIPAAYLGTVAAVALLFPAPGVGHFQWMTAQLLSGGLMLGAFFFATDPVTSPVTPRGQTMYGVGCGLLTMLLRYHSSYPEGVGWAILTMNCCVWLLDRAGMPRRYGEQTFAVTGHWVRRARRSLSTIKLVVPKLPKLKAGQMPGEAHLDQIRSTGIAAAKLAAVILATALMVGGVHRLTDLRQVQAATQTQQELLDQVMPMAATRTETPYTANGALSITAGYSADNKLVGYCVEVQSHGFGGMITMVVGVDLDGKVTGVAITDHKENNGVGTEAMTPGALQRYVGRSGTLHTSGYNSVEAVSGATATSKALTAGVSRALAIVANLDPEGVELDEDTSL